MLVARVMGIGSFVVMSVFSGFAFAESRPGLVNVFYWNNIPGDKVSDLTEHPDYPHNPHGTGELKTLDSPRNQADNFGVLVRGFIEAPLSGEYRFHVSGDDETQFFLSSSDLSRDSELIADVSNWTKVGEFNDDSSQSSGLHTLKAGARYYFEIRFKEGSGADHFTVAWEGPGFSRRTVPSSALHSWPLANSLDETSHSDGLADDRFTTSSDDGDEILNSREVTNPQAYQGQVDPRTLESTAVGSSSGGVSGPDPAAGEAALSWTAPLTRVNGSSLSLSQIDHYLISYGTAPSALTRQVRVAGHETRYQFQDLGAGKWYFSIQVVDRDARVSAPSDKVSKPIL